MILSAKIPRWWNVTPAQIHWVGLHLRYGRELLAEAALDRDAAHAGAGLALGTLAAPVRHRARSAALLEQGAVQATPPISVTPSELYLIARDVGATATPRRFLPACGRAEAPGRGGSPKEINYAAISRAFGTPKPTLANSYEPELLNLRTFPTLMGYSSRIMAESWESNTLYWAALADETQRRARRSSTCGFRSGPSKLVEQIFASHLEDWPALLKSLRSVGDDVRAHTPSPGHRTEGCPAE